MFILETKLQPCWCYRHTGLWHGCDTEYIISDTQETEQQEPWLGCCGHQLLMGPIKLMCGKVAATEICAEAFT